MVHGHGRLLDRPRDSLGKTRKRGEAEALPVADSPPWLELWALPAALLLIKDRVPGSLTNRSWACAIIPFRNVLLVHLLNAVILMVNNRFAVETIRRARSNHVYLAAMHQTGGNWQ